MARFRELTSNSIVVMGRKTLDSLPKMLPNRKHWVLTRDADKIRPDFYEHAGSCAFNDVWIIGGGEIYSMLIHFAEEIHLTVLHARYGCDTFFPRVHLAQWREISAADHPADEKNAAAYRFAAYDRVSQ